MPAPRQSVLSVAAILTFATLGLAQQRAAMTCTVHDPQGRALAGAEVVCVQQCDPDADRADRVRARSDDRGACTLDLLVGHGYWLWVIGPRDADGNQLVVPPADIAAAGRALKLQANLQLTPIALDVRGAAEWLGDDLGGGPLALRLGMAPGAASGAALGIALGPDIPLPGDGMVPLPPLPDTRFDVALVDGRGEVVASLSLDTATTTVAQFPSTRTFVAEVTDEAGHALPGAQVLRFGQRALPAADGRHSRNRWSPIAAICDEQGRARCRVAEGDFELFVATHDGHTAMVSGWFEGMRFENDQPRGRGGEPAPTLSFALPTSEPNTLRVRGATADAALTVAIFDFRMLRSGRRSVPALMHFPTSAGADGVFATYGPSTGSTRGALVTGLRQLPVPQRTRVEVPPRGRTTQFDELDLTALRTLRIQVVDADGAPVPGARIEALELGHHHTMPECEVHTDGDGRAELRLPRAGYALHATTTEQHGLTLAPLDDDQPLRVVVQPMATVRLRIVDARGEPVAGARVEAQGHVEARDASAGSEAGERGDFAAGEHAAAAFARARSGPDGKLLVRCVDGGSVAHVMLTAVHGERRGEPVELRLDGELQTLTLPDTPR